MTENEFGEKLKTKKSKTKKKSKHQHGHHQSNNSQQNGSTTSLDEEDLDLNDLKDFEDVTFDNLRKPGEGELKADATSAKKQPATVEKPEPAPKPFKNALSIRMQELKQDTNSEQSLLLKSSSSSESKCSSDNTINNICGASNSTNTTSATNTSSELRSSSDFNRAGSSGSGSNSGVLIEPAASASGKAEVNLMENVVDELNSKTYEETEI